MKTWVIFDWEDTLMRHFPSSKGPMCTWPRVEEMPGARKLLHSIHGKLGIAMVAGDPASEASDVRRALERAGLASFIKHIYCARDLGSTKCADFYLEVLKDLHVHADQAVMVGDSFQEDVEAARSAGLRAIWFNAKDSETHAGERYTTVHKLEAVAGVLMGWGMLARI